ncbi:MAG: ribbon-helix-helix domain-containing protein [Chitinispirillaceae bacterium]
MAPDTVSVSFRLPGELVDRLKQTARKLGIKQTAIVEHAIEKELKRLEKKPPIFDK